MTSAPHAPAPLSLALMGFGRIAERVHLPVLRNLSGARVTAIVEADPARRKDAAQWLDASAIHANAEAVWENPAVDAVIICLPPALHAEAALAARSAGKHCYLEKPIATTPEEGRRILDAWRDAPLTAQIGFNYRHHPLVRELRARIHSGELGEIRSVRSRFHSHTGAMQSWKQTRTQGGGVLLDLASHHLDLIPHLLGVSVQSVEATLASIHSEADKAEITLHLARDIQATSSFSLVDGNEDLLEVTGSKKSLVFDRQRGLSLRAPDAPPLPPWPQRLWLAAKHPHVRAKLLHPGAEPSYEAALGHFLNAIRAGEAGSPSLRDGQNSLLLVAAAERAAETGNPQKIEPSPSPA